MLKSNFEIYTKESSSYGAASYWRTDEEYVARNCLKKPKLLVLGCGGGRTLSHLHNHRYEITAIDIVPTMVTEAKNNVEGLPITVLEMDATNLQFDDAAFDSAFFPFHGIDYVEPDIYAAVTEAARVLKPDGVLVFSSHNRYYLKKLHRFFAGKFDTYRGLRTYRTDLSDRRHLRDFFESVEVIQRISLLPWRHCNWKDVVYRLMPFFNKSTYFICKKPRKYVSN